MFGTAIGPQKRFWKDPFVPVTSVISSRNCRGAVHQICFALNLNAEWVPHRTRGRRPGKFGEAAPNKLFKIVETPRPPKRQRQPAGLMCIYPQPKAARPIGGQAFRWAVPTDADGGPRRVERRASKKAEERHAKRHRTKPAGNACTPAPASFASPTHCGVRAEPVQRPESSTATAKRMYSSLRARPAHATAAQKNAAARRPGHGGRSLGLQLEAQGGASALRRHGTNVAPNNMAHISRSDVKKAYDDLFFASDDGDNTAGRPCRHRFLSAAASLLRPPASFPRSARGPSATDCAWFRCCSDERESCGGQPACGGGASTAVAT